MSRLSRFLRVNQRLLHYLEWDGYGQPAILVHATSLCAGTWKPLAASLSSRFHVFALDQRGHGDSEKSSDAYSWENLGHDLAGFADSLDLRSALLVGHSSGGVAAIHAAALRPKLAWRLVLIEPTMLLDGSTQNPGQSGNLMAERARKRRALWDSQRQAYETLRSRDLFRTWREDVFRAYIEDGTRTLPDGRVELKCPPDVEAQFYEARPQFDPWVYVSQVRCPVLLILGANTHLVRPESLSLRRFLELAPQTQVAWVPGAGHMVPQERPEEVERLVWEFVQRKG